MMESTGNEPSGTLFARILQTIEGRGVDIRNHLSGHALRLEFADGQRIVINFDEQTHNVWLATRSGGTEFIHHNGTWHTSDRKELFSTLHAAIEQAIASNPLNSRPPETLAQRSPVITPVFYVAEKENHTLRNLLIVLLAAVLGFWAALRLTKPHESTQTKSEASFASFSQSSSTKQCSNGFPENGSVTIFPGSGLRTDGSNDPEITLNNDHAHPLLLILSTPQNSIPAMSVLIHARQHVTLHLTSGQYNMMFSVGNNWCDPKTGFSDGHLVRLDKPLNVQMDKPMQLSMQTSGAGLEDFQVFVKTATPEVALPTPTFSGDGSMEVQRHANGHFYLPGSIDSVPVTFMVDTGASVTSISSAIARSAGVHNCKEVQFNTAGGTATGCIALIPRMMLGNFVLQNITVAVMPNLETNLLGANVLRNFQVSQNDSMMLIGRK